MKTEMQTSIEAYSSSLAGEDLQAALDDYHAHEALDRAHLIRSMIYEHLSTHPYIAADARLLALVDSAAESLNTVYQEIGERHLVGPSVDRPRIPN